MKNKDYWYTTVMTIRILFALFAGLILIGASYFSAKIYSSGFNFTGITTKMTFLTFLLIPFLFIAGLIGKSITKWDISPTIYTAIQVIAGVGFYLFVGALALGAIMGIAHLFHITIPTIVTAALFTLSLVFAGLGLWQAQHIITTDYTVTLPDAPSAWDGKKAILVTDTHFGLVNHAAFSYKVIDHIIALKPDFVLHAGDFYDGPMVPTAPITKSWQTLASNTPVFYAPGNHEMYGDYAAFIKSIAAAGVTVLDNKKTTYEGVQIAGITYHEGQVSEEASKAIADLAIDSTVPSILINHPPTSLAAANTAGVSLMVSGHTHNGQFWPMNYLVRFVYKQYAYGLNAYKNMEVITSKGVGTFGPPFRLFNSPELVRITFKTK